MHRGDGPARSYIRQNSAGHHAPCAAREFFAPFCFIQKGEKKRLYDADNQEKAVEVQPILSKRHELQMHYPVH